MIVLLVLVGILFHRVTQLDRAMSEAQSELVETKDTIRDLRTILSGYQSDFMVSDLSKQIVALPVLEPLPDIPQQLPVMHLEADQMLLEEMTRSSRQLQPIRHGLTLPLKHTNSEVPRSFKTVPAEYPGVNWHSFGLY